MCNILVLKQATQRVPYSISCFLSFKHLKIAFSVAVPTSQWVPQPTCSHKCGFQYHTDFFQETVWPGTRLSIDIVTLLIADPRNISSTAIYFFFFLGLKEILPWQCCWMTLFWLITYSTMLEPMGHRLLQQREAQSWWQVSADGEPV